MTFVCHFPFHILSSKSKTPSPLKITTIMLPSKPDKRSKTFSAFNCVDKKRWTRETSQYSSSYVSSNNRKKTSVFGKFYENLNSKVFPFIKQRKAEKRAKLRNNIYKQANMPWCERYVSITWNEIFIIKWWETYICLCAKKQIFIKLIYYFELQILFRMSGECSQCETSSNAELNE